jgi:sugar phosphate isomerase/epimerase
MSRPITIFSGQWADLPLAGLAKKVSSFGYDGLELACWGEHFDVSKAVRQEKYCLKTRELLEKNNLRVFSLGAYHVGQAVLDRIDARHKEILPPHVWGDGDPAGVHARAAEELKNTARAAQKLGVGLVTGFTGSSIWHLLYPFPPVSPEMIDAGFDLLAERFHPILDVFGECGVKFALEVHPAQIVFDLYTAQRALQALDNREEFGFNFDPSHLIWQGVDPVEFIRAFPDRIYHVHLKDVHMQLDGRSSLLGSHLPAGDPRRGWESRSLGHGEINFEEILRALNAADYAGPLSVEWSDRAMDRDRGPQEARALAKRLDFEASRVAFDAAFDKKERVGAGG